MDPRDSPFLVFEGEGRQAEALVTELGRSDVHVSLRNGRIRVTPHIHNDIRDVERLGAVLAGA